MSQTEHYEILILGSGAGGKLLAWHLARSGRRTAVVERRWIGGSCPNVNCLPSKNEIWSAKVAHLVRHAAQFGTMTGPVAIDMATVRHRKRDMVDGQIAGPRLQARPAWPPAGRGAHGRTPRSRATVLPRTRVQGKVGDAMLGEAERRREFFITARVRGRPRIAPPGMTRRGADDSPRRCRVGKRRR